ncbi:ADP-dependent ribose-1-phosphate kinase [Chlorella vulgaris]
MADSTPQGAGEGPSSSAAQSAAQQPDLTAHVERLEARAKALERLLIGKVEWAQMETAQHLQLLEAAVDNLEGTAKEAAARHDELLLAAKRLALELRGLDLLADHVKAVDALSKKLEAQVQEHNSHSKPPKNCSSYETEMADDGFQDAVAAAVAPPLAEVAHDALLASQQNTEAAQVQIVSLQPAAIVDHVCVLDEEALRSLVPDELGGSHRVELAEVQRTLTSVGEYFSKAGGSAANTTRGLAGLGVHTKLLGCRGFDEWGTLFSSSMKRAGVDVSGVLVKQGPTGRSCILSCGGQRTMRTCLSGCPRINPDELRADDFRGVPWVFLSAYCLYTPNLLERALELAGAAGCSVAMDLASFEVRGAIDVCFCNEDEAAEVAGATGSCPEAAIEYLAQHCKRLAVVTLGEKGCLIKERGSEEVIGLPACSGVKVTDTTGAGDLFAAGFLYGLLKGYPARRCGELGCIAGGAVVQTLGAEMGRDQWSWLHQRMHGRLAGEVVRDSAAAVQREMLACYSLIERKGRGVVYYGSARLKQDSPHWDRAVQLGRDVAQLLGCTTWSGGGPGMMEAATIGALSVGKPVGGIRIQREAGTTVRTASYLPANSQVFCRYLSSRKVALVDSGVRMKESDHTAYLFLPGGLGTMDELFEILTLVQLKKLGSSHPVPVVLIDYDGFYSGLLQFLRACDANGTVGAPELRDLIVAQDNAGVLQVLMSYYNLPSDGASHEPAARPSSVYRASAYIRLGGDEQAAGSAGL